MKRMCDLYADGNLRFIVTNSTTSDIEYIYKRWYNLHILYTEVTNILTLQETIRPSADLRNHYSEISKLCKENKEAVIITVNGRVAPITETFDDLRKISKWLYMQS